MTFVNVWLGSSPQSKLSTPSPTDSIHSLGVIFWKHFLLYPQIPLCHIVLVSSSSTNRLKSRLSSKLLSSRKMNLSFPDIQSKRLQCTQIWDHFVKSCQLPISVNDIIRLAESGNWMTEERPQRCHFSITASLRVTPYWSVDQFRRLSGHNTAHIKTRIRMTIKARF